VAFLGTPESAIEGIEVNLVGVALNTAQQPVFIVGEGYRSRFGVPEQAVQKELDRLRDCGAWIMSVSEVLSSDQQIEVLWTAPAEQENPLEPEALESSPPGEPGAGI
jgi:biotin operon repressor